jgi:hypothetical protein
MDSVTQVRGRPASRWLIALVGLALVLAGIAVGAAPAAAKESVPPPTAAIYACDSATPVALGTSACPRPSAALARPRSESTPRLVRPSDGHRGFGVAAETATAAEGEGGAALGETDPFVTVRHFTDDLGRSQIEKSGNLRAGTYATSPEEIAAGTSPEGVEKLLEIESGKGSNFIDVLTRRSNLGLPENGPVTSDGAWPRILQNPVDVGGGGFLP